MTKRMSVARRAAVMGMAGAMALAASGALAEPRTRAAIRADVQGRGAAADNQLKSEIGKANAASEDYRVRSRKAKKNDQLTGGFLVLSGFYGALVTAFNPAPKNLKAAILASGTATGLRAGLPFRERSGVYLEGHRAMECIATTAEPLTEYRHVPTIFDLRSDALDALKFGDAVLVATAEGRTGEARARSAAAAKARSQAAPSSTDALVRIEALAERMAAQAEDNQRKLLEERMKTLAELDKALAEEEGAYWGAPIRVANVRRQVQVVVDQRLAAAAPDYDAIVKAMGETAKPEAAPEQSKEGEAETQNAKAAARSSAPENRTATIEEALTKVDIAIRDLQAKSPKQATTAYKDLGECVPKAAS